MRAAVDVMGGDHAPGEILKGCWEAAPLLGNDDVVYLVGDEKVVADGLSASGLGAQQKSRLLPKAARMGTRPEVCFRLNVEVAERRLHVGGRGGTPASNSLASG